MMHRFKNDRGTVGTYTGDAVVEVAVSEATMLTSSELEALHAQVRCLQGILGRLVNELPTAETVLRVVAPYELRLP